MEISLTGWLYTNDGLVDSLATSRTVVKGRKLKDNSRRLDLACCLLCYVVWGAAREFNTPWTVKPESLRSPS